MGGIYLKNMMDIGHGMERILYQEPEIFLPHQNGLEMWMPHIVLDGELFLGRECFEDCGLFRKKTPNDEEWLKSSC